MSITAIITTTIIVAVVFIKDHEIISYVWWNNRMNPITALITGLDPMIKKLAISEKAFK